MNLTQEPEVKPKAITSWRAHGAGRSMPDYRSGEDSSKTVSISMGGHTSFVARTAQLECPHAAHIELSGLKTYKDRMARTAVENSRLEMRVSPDEKSKLLRAAALQRRDLTDFAKQALLQAAQNVIEQAERMELSSADTKVWLDMLDNPPQPNERLIAAAKALLTNEHIKLA